MSDEQMSVFAPTREGMEDLMERVEAILQEEEEMEVSGECVWLYRPAGLLVIYRIHYSPPLPSPPLSSPLTSPPLPPSPPPPSPLPSPPPSKEFEVGAIYPAVVRDIRDYGLIVELAPGVDILLHKSQMSHKMVRLSSSYCICD